MPLDDSERGTRLVTPSVGRGNPLGNRPGRGRYPPAGSAQVLARDPAAPVTVPGRQPGDDCSRDRGLRIPYRGVLGGSDHPEQQPGADLCGVGSVFEGRVIPGSHQHAGGLLGPPGRREAPGRTG